MNDLGQMNDLGGNPLVTNVGDAMVKRLNSFAAFCGIALGALAVTLPLDTAAARVRPISGVVRLHQLCAQMGLVPGNYDFYFCVQSLAQSAGIDPTLASQSNQVDRTLVVDGDFYHGPERAREQRACAGLGLAVGSARFAQCVGNLDASMQNVQHQYPY